MSIESVIKELKSVTSKNQSFVKRMTEIQRLEKDRSKNLGKLRGNVKAVETALETMDRGTAAIVRPWIEEYRADLQKTADSVRSRFGLDLEEHLKTAGLELKGQYPFLHAGLYTFEVDFEQSVCTIWYGNQQERLAKCVTDATTVATEWQEQRKNLGSSLDTKQFADTVGNAYEMALVKYGTSKEVSVTGLLPFIALLLQEKRFWQEPVREHFRSYRRADFSYDLFRCRVAISSSFRLTIATRQQTQRRQDCLWIPTNERGDGSLYSTIRRNE